MAKLTTTDLTTITGNETSTVVNINNNFAAVETAMENTLSRDGTAPNTMDASIDMNSNDLLNVDAIDVQSLTLDGISMLNALPSVTPRGNWVTTTAYVVGDLVLGDNVDSTYICNTLHTSGTFATDLAVPYWTLFASPAGVIETPERFNGDAVTVAFTLSIAPASEDACS